MAHSSGNPAQAAQARRVTPFSDPHARFSAGRFGLNVFLASLGMLFAASLLGFLVIRIQNRDVWPTDLPPLPRSLLLSTMVLAMSSITAQWSLVGVRNGRHGQLHVGLAATFRLGLLFLAVQVLSWLAWLGPIAHRWGGAEDHRLALTAFYVLTGLHALHVMGGLVPMGIALVAAVRERYSAENHALVQHCTTYWHFLGLVWLVLYGVMVMAI